MRLIIAYPIPFDAFSTFEPFVRRFVESFKQFGPGVSDYEVWAMCCWGMPTPEIRSWFYGIKTKFVPYMDHGCDLGSHQFAAAQCRKNSLLVGMTSRCYFHRAGWGARYIEARERHGAGLYGASVSREGGKLHVCTRGHAMDSDLWNRFPQNIDTREKGQFFEVGAWCVTEWAKNAGLKTMQITWDTERDIENAHDPFEQGIYRRNNQSAMLLWDKHTDAYRDSEPEEKLRLAEICFGK